MCGSFIEFHGGTRGSPTWNLRRTTTMSSKIHKSHETNAYFLGYLPGWPSPTDSEVKRKLVSCCSSGGVCPLAYPFMWWAVSGIFFLFVIVDTAFGFFCLRSNASSTCCNSFDTFSLSDVVNSWRKQGSSVLSSVYTLLWFCTSQPYTSTAHNVTARRARSKCTMVQCRSRKWKRLPTLW